MAAKLVKQSGKKVVYQSLIKADFTATLRGVDLPAELTDILVDSDADASKGGLLDDSHALNKLIDRPATSLADSVKGIV